MGSIMSGPVRPHQLDYWLGRRHVGDVDNHGIHRNDVDYGSASAADKHAALAGQCPPVTISVTRCH